MSSEIEPSSLSKAKNTLLPTLTALLELGVQGIPDSYYKSIGVIIAPFIAVVLNIGIKHLYKRYNCSAIIKLHSKWNRRLKDEYALQTTTEQRKTEILKEISDNEAEIKKLEKSSINIDFD